MKAIAGRCEAVLVIGAPNSSNSLRLVEVAEREGCKARLVARGADVDLAWLDGVSTLGITAGASAPDVLVRGVVERLRALGAGNLTQLDGEPENMVFALPNELRIRVVD